MMFFVAGRVKPGDVNIASARGIDSEGARAKAI
jgi:hypothetical protein